MVIIFCRLLQYKLIVYNSACKIELSFQYELQMSNQSNVDRIYSDLKSMASCFVMKPDEKLNETRLANQLGASRTPLREALNRLVSEGFITFEQGRGFSCRTLNATDILDLYQAREAIECKTVELACKRTNLDILIKLKDSLEADEGQYQSSTPSHDLVSIDESFHLEIARLAQNSELHRILKNLNERIRYIRTFDLEERLVVTPQNHMDILNAMIDGNVIGAVKCMQAHILRSSKEATEAVRKAYAKIYVPNEGLN